MYLSSINTHQASAVLGKSEDGEKRMRGKGFCPGAHSPWVDLQCGRETGVGDLNVT